MKLTKEETFLLEGMCKRCKSEGCSIQEISDLLTTEDENDPILKKLIRLRFVRKDEANSSHNVPTFKVTAKGWNTVNK